MKSVGIMTWFFGPNYGAKAQAYALQQVIKELGYNSMLVNYQPLKWKRLYSHVRTSVPDMRKHPIKVINSIRKFYMFERTSKLYSKTLYVNNAREIDELNLECIVFGSDAIFNQKHPLYEDLYYGVGIEKTKKITYAPSCEYLQPDSTLSSTVIASLQNMSSLSVRDINTQRLILNNTGRQSKIVLDPTILYDFIDIRAKLPDYRYALVYTFSDWKVYSEQFREYAKNHELKIIAVGKKLDWADICIENASFEQWVSYFRSADIVFTDSFHGTVFSIKNRKDMILCCRDDKRSKIQSLLNDAGIERGFYDGRQKLDAYLEVPIDYSVVGRHLDMLIKESKDYLRVALQRE